MIKIEVMEMRTISVKQFKDNQKKIVYILFVLLIISVSITLYSLLNPPFTSKQITENNLEIKTFFDYKATVRPNVLYPTGGTVVVGDKIIKNITTSIPVNLKSTITSENEVIAKGSYEIQLVVKAPDLWERSFPLEKKQSFEYNGAQISILDRTLNVNLEEVKSFIKQVEDEIGISPDQYSIEIVPNIIGTINYKGEEKAFHSEDNLVFQFYYDEIQLASDKNFSTAIPFISTEVYTNTLKILGISFPLISVRIASAIFSSLLLFAVIFTSKKFLRTQVNSIYSQINKINKKYGNRIIFVTQKVNMDDKSIITLSSFKSILKVADEKELPVFCHKTHEEGTAIYFIVDGDYVYNYETIRFAQTQSNEKGIISEKAYVNS